MDEGLGVLRSHWQLSYVHVALASGEDGYAVYVGAGEVEPEVGDDVLGLGGVGWVSVDVGEVLPAAAR